MTLPSYDVFHSLKSFEVSVLSPEVGLVSTSCSQNNAIRQWEFKIKADPRRPQCERSIQIYDVSLLHVRYSLQRVGLSTLLEKALKDLQNVY